MEDYPPPTMEENEEGERALQFSMGDSSPDTM
jgi:hypothetical protein